MRILLIKPKQIGDSLILTPTITAIRKAHPHAEIWVVIRRGCEGILAGCPDIARILTVAPVEKGDRRKSDLWMGFKTICQLCSHKFDYAFELGDGGRGRNLLRLAWVRSGHRFSVKPTDEKSTLSLQKAGVKISTFDWQTCHRVEKDFYSVNEFLPLAKPIPSLCFEQKLTKPWAAGRKLTNFCVVQIGSRQGFNCWSEDRWLKVCRAMLEKFENVVISCGPVPRERQEAASLLEKLGPRALSTEGNASWAEMAWLLYRAKLYVGPNTAAMHLAAACQCPTVTLFGPSIEDHWHPWRVAYRIVTSRGYVPVTNTVERYTMIKLRSMDDIEVRDVIATCLELLSRLGKIK